MWPVPTDDPFHFRLTCANLGALWRNYAAAGATTLVLGGVAESRDEVAAYREALDGTELSVVWLRASVATLQQRVRTRNRDVGSALDWHLRRARELDAILTKADVADFELWTDGRTVVEVGGNILRRLGWVADATT